MTSSRRRFVGASAAGLAMLAVAGVPSLAHAAEVQIQASLARPQIDVGQSVYLQIEVSTDSGSIGHPRFVKLEDVDVVERGSSSGMSVEISGARSVRRSTKTFTYVLTPRAPGEHEINIEVDVGGSTYRPTSAPKLLATGAGFVPELEHDKAGDSPPSADAEVIVWPVVDKATAYVGEQIIYELQIWERARGNLSIAGAPTFKDFWSEDLHTARQQQQRRGAEQKLLDGVPYRVHQTMRRALFPQKTGTLTIGGPQVQLQAMSGPFFGGSGPPKSYIGRNLAIEVLPLPAAGQPPGFRANSVGQLRITTEVDRTEIRQGEAVRLSVRIFGTGNIALIELPELPVFDGLRTYEPKPETPKLQLDKPALRGSRVFTMLVVADRAGKLEIPALELPYFDPKADKYRVARSKAIVLEVEANPDAAPGPTESESERERGQDQDQDQLLAPPIAGQELSRVTPRERWLSTERWWLGTLGAPALLGLGRVGAKLRERFGPDDDARARSQELARRRTLLNEANAAVAEGEGFHPRLAELLQSAAVTRAGPEGVGLTRERLMTLLAEQGATADEVELLRELLDTCDAARFGSGSGDAQQRREHLERARELLGRGSWRPK